MARSRGNSRQLPSEDYYVSGGDTDIGDIEVLTGLGWGGDDNFYGYSHTNQGYMALGDAMVIQGRARGGNDSFYGGDFVGYSGGYSGGFSGGIDSIAQDVPILYFSGGVVFAGDAQEITEFGKGGNDDFHGGTNSLNIFVGDALNALSGEAVGGKDLMEGGGADGYALVGSVDAAYVPDPDGYATNFLIGDGYALEDASRGGADDIFGGSAGEDSGYSGITSLTPVGGDAEVYNLLAGDGYVMTDAARGANDFLVGGNAYETWYGSDSYALNVMTGDAFVLAGDSRGGNDQMVGGSVIDTGLRDVAVDTETVDGYDVVMNLMAGDAFYVDGNVRFGNDTLTGGDGSSGYQGYTENYIYGDVSSFSGLVAPDGVDSEAFGALELFPAQESDGRPHKYGNDELFGGDGNAMNVLVGDARTIYFDDRGGNDLLVAGGSGSSNDLIGDAEYIYSGGQGGRDTLVGGESDDEMWGDARYCMEGQGGADRFVFDLNNGADTVYDFRVYDGDQIDLSALSDESDFADFEALVESGRIWDDHDGVYIDLGPNFEEESVGPSGRSDSVVLVGVCVADLSAEQFIF